MHLFRIHPPIEEYQNNIISFTKTDMIHEALF